MDTQQVWEAYHQDVKRFIFSKVRDEQATNDLLQEVFLKVHTKSDQLADPSKVKSWLFTIAYRASIDYLKTTRVEISVDDVPIIEESNNGDHTELDCLPGIINKLPDKYRKPIYLSDVKGFKQTEIAKKLDVPLPTIKSQIQRGRKLITQGYVKCCDYQLDKNGKLVGERKEKENCTMCH